MKLLELLLTAKQMIEIIHCQASAMLLPLQKMQVLKNLFFKKGIFKECLDCLSRHICLQMHISIETVYIVIQYIVDILFHQITEFIKVHVAFVFGLQALQSIDFSKIFWLKGLKPNNKCYMNFYECCELTKKVCLVKEFTGTFDLQLDFF